MILPHKTIRLCSKTYNHVAQNPIIHIQTALPENLPGINAQSIPLLDMVV